MLTGLAIAWGEIDKRFVIQVTIVSIVTTLVLHVLFVKVLKIQALVGVFGI
jgi:hypothetical protein